MKKVKEKFRFKVVATAPELGPNVFLTEKEYTGETAVLRVRPAETAPKVGSIIWAHAQAHKFRKHPELLVISHGHWQILVYGLEWSGPGHCMNCNKRLMGKRTAPFRREEYCPDCNPLPEVVVSLREAAHQDAIWNAIKEMGEPHSGRRLTRKKPQCP